MDAEFRYLDGPFQGESRIIRKDFATIGRDPSADLTFDAQADQGVSGRHAAVYRHGGEWMLRDLGGAGGTWINDRRLRGDTPLSPGDVIRFGNPGPRLGFGPREPGAAPAAAPAITRPSAAPTAPAAAAPPRPRPAAAPVRAPRPAPSRSRLPFVGALVVVAAAVAGYALLNRRAVPPALPHSSTPAPPAPPALPDSGTPAPRHAGTPLALDSVLHRAAGTVVLVVAGYQDGRWPVGSGVILEARNDTAWIVTAARYAADPRGRPPLRIGLLLPGAGEYLRGELAVPLDGSGTALLRVRTAGGALGAAPLGEATGGTDSVAVIGVMLGPDSLPAGNWRREGLRVNGTAAAIAASGSAPDRVDAPGHQAGPGHPVFDRDGRLVGVVAEADSTVPGRLRVIPAARIRELLGRRPRRE